MPDYSKNYNLIKPLEKEFYDVNLVNENTDSIDEELKRIQDDVNDKVDKVDGKGLSANDYTDMEKAKLEGIANGATASAKSTTVPKMDGTAFVGNEADTFASGDHVHPTDVTRAPLESPVFTGTPSAPTAVVGTNTSQVATTAFVQSTIANTAPTTVLGETADTAYRGDRGKIAYDHAQLNGGNPHGVTKSNIGLGSVDNTADSQKTVNHANTAGNCTGNAVTATKLQTARTINGVNFDGSANITIYDSTKANIANPSFSGTFSLNRRTGSAIGAHSVATGSSTIASGNYSFSEGDSTIASGNGSHAEGSNTIALGNNSHAEGDNTSAVGNSSHAEGCDTESSGICSHAGGYGTVASGDYSHAEGTYTRAEGKSSHAEGDNAVASGDYSHAEGVYTSAANYASHAGGKCSRAMTVGGASGNTVGDVFVIGNGKGIIPAALSNAFRITYAGEVYAKAAYNASGADYAEYFEWLDGNPDNEDRVGLFVTMDGEKIKIASKGDYILGIVSALPCIIGNADEDWAGRWQKDAFGRYLTEEVESAVTETVTKEISVLDEDGKETGETELVSEEIETGEIIKGWGYVQNPTYNPHVLYVERKDRKEWSAIGMVGVLAVRDDGTCEINGYCKCSSGGIATRVEKRDMDTYRVIGRISESIIKVVLK